MIIIIGLIIVFIIFWYPIIDKNKTLICDKLKELYTNTRSGYIGLRSDIADNNINNFENIKLKINSHLQWKRYAIVHNIEKLAHYGCVGSKEAVKSGRVSA